MKVIPVAGRSYIDHETLLTVANVIPQQHSFFLWLPSSFFLKRGFNKLIFQKIEKKTTVTSDPRPPYITHIHHILQVYNQLGFPVIKYGYLNLTRNPITKAHDSIQSSPLPIE